jgi:hypothetical protein
MALKKAAQPIKSLEITAQLHRFYIHKSLQISYSNSFMELCLMLSVNLIHILLQELSVLLVCYAAHQGHIEMLRYLLDLPQTQEDKDKALEQLPHSKACHAHINNIRYV